MICPECKSDNGSQGFRCYKCGAELRPQSSTAFAAGDGVFSLDKYLLSQKVFSLGGRYYVSDEAGNKIIFVERELLKMRPKIHFYADEDRTTLLMSVIVKPKGFLDLGDTRHVVLPSGEPLAILRLNVIKGVFFGDRWQLLSPDWNPIGSAEENPALSAFLRRWFPYGRFFFKTNFNFILGTRQVGTLIRKSLLLDKYVLDLTQDYGKSLDRRVAVALAVLIDTYKRK